MSVEFTYYFDKDELQILRIWKETYSNLLQPELEVVQLFAAPIWKFKEDPNLCLINDKLTQTPKQRYQINPEQLNNTDRFFKIGEYVECDVFRNMIKLIYNNSSLTKTVIDLAQLLLSKRVQVIGGC